MTAELRVLGPLRVITPAGEDLALGGPQQRLVLAVLALRANEVVPADVLVDALWNGSTPATATNVVSTYVSRLRKVLSTLRDARLASRPRGYVLEIDRVLVDAHSFVGLVERGRKATRSGHLDDSLAAFDTALGLWRGAMLAELNRPEALRPEISRLEEMRLGALEDRIDVRLAAGHHVEVVAELEGLTAAHPFRERFWGQLVVALYRSGRQADALSAYQSVRSLLVNQLGVEPGPELQALEHDVLMQVPELRWQAPGSARNGEGDPSRARGPASPGGSANAVGESPSAGSDGTRVPLPPGLAVAAHSYPFVGRDRERSWLAAGFEEARAGRFSPAFVEGSPGIGKTALVRWFARREHADGAVVVLGRADEGAGVPFLPFKEAIQHWATHIPPSELSLLDEAAVDHLGRLVPEVADRRGAPRPPTFHEPTSPTDRHLLFQAIGRWVEALAARGPAVVVLEDLHWADPGSLLALRHLLRHPPRAGAFLVATYRDADLGEGHELADLVSELRGDHDAIRCTLPGLPDAEAIELVSTRAGGELVAGGRELAAHLNRATGGNPLFIHEMIQHLTERGIIDPAAQQWDGRQPAMTFGLPSAVVEVIEQRLRRLPEPTTTVLRHAAVLGERFSLAVLGRIVDMPEISVVEALEPAVGAGLVAPGGDRAACFTFSHALVRDAILHGFPLSQRIRVHWEAGQAIAALAGSQPDPPLGDIARHLAAGVHAGDPHAATVANVRAGRQALLALAFEDARARFATAAELAEAAGLSDPELAYEAWTGFGQASSVLGDFAGHRDGFLQAALIARENTWVSRLADAASGIASAGGGTGDPTDQDLFSALIDEALAGLDGTPSASHCLLLGVKTVRTVSMEGGDPEPAATLAAELAQAVGDPMADAGALMAKAWARLGTPRAHDVNEAATRALMLEEPSVIVSMLNFMAPLVPAAALQLGDRERFEQLRNRLARDSRTRDAPHLAAYVRTWDAALALSEGRFAEAERLGATIAESSDWLFWRLVARSQANATARERGRHTQVKEALARSVAAGLPPHVTAPIRAMLAAVHAEALDHGCALDQVSRLRRDSDLKQLGWGAPFVLRNLAEVAGATGDVELAADLLEILTGYGGQILVSFTGVTIEAAADRAIGQVLITLGRLDDALEHLATAQALEEGFGAWALVARTAYWHARARLERRGPSDEETARELLDQAVSLARKFGMEHLERVGLELRLRPR